MDDGTHIARLQARVGHGDGQNHTFVFLDHGAFHSSCGYAVTNLAVLAPLSIIQIVRSNGASPAGDAIRPIITYFSPCGDFIHCVTSFSTAKVRKASANIFHSLRWTLSLSKNCALPPLSGCAGLSR